MAWSIDRYLNIRQAYAPTIRSDGKALAFLTNVTGTPQVWRVPLRRCLCRRCRGPTNSPSGRTG